MNNSPIFKAMFDEATLGILVVDSRGLIKMANPLLEKIFAYAKGELIGKKMELLIPQPLRKTHVKHRTNFHKRPEHRAMGANLDLYGMRKDGEIFPVEVSLTYVEENQERLAIAYVNDSTNKQRRLNELKESHHRLEEAQAIGKLGSFEWSFENNEIKWSDELFRIFGFEPQSFKVSPETVFPLIHPDDLPLLKKTLEQIRQEKISIPFDYRIVTPKNEIRHLRGLRKVELDDDGNLIRMYGLLQDVTEIKKFETINKDISRIVEESLNEVFIFDATDYKFIQVNKGARQNIGYTLDEMRNLTPVDIKPEHDFESFKKLVQPLVEGKTEKLIFETIHQRKDKSTYFVEVHLQYSSLGGQAVFVAIIVDITESKKAKVKLENINLTLEDKVKERTEALQENEKRLEKALSTEKELGELKSRFVSMASHEFRTPLSTILSSSGLIARYTNAEDQDKRMKHVDRIKSSVNNLTSILNDLLSLEKLESGKVATQTEEFDIHAFIAEVLEETNPSYRKRIVHENTGATIARADKHLLKNSLLNLLSNAIKYSPEEESVEIISSINNNLLTLQVKDHGIGIPKADHQHMFTRFFRANNVTNIQGTGLGLTIVKRYIDLMKGKIDFVSIENEGTTFTIEIPQ